MTVEVDTAAGLRRWARGLLTVEAATELLIRSCGGRFARPGQPWIRTDRGGAVWVEWRSITEESTGALSGGERRMLLTAASLANGGPVDLGDVASGIDRHHARLLLAAIAHAAGDESMAPWPVGL